MSAAAMAFENNKMVLSRRLMEDTRFASSVQSQNVKEAAQLAAELLLQQQQQMRSAQQSLPGLYVVPHFKPNDHVRLKDRAGRGPLPPGGIGAEGRVLAAAAPVAGKGTTVRVRWAEGQERDHSSHDLELIRQIEHAEGTRSGGPKLNIRLNGQDVKSLKKTPNKSKEIIKRVKKELTEMETALPWHMVEDVWKQRRASWRNKVKAAEQTPVLSLCLKELLAVLKIQRDMPSVLLRMKEDQFVTSLDDIASNRAPQASTELLQLWDQIKLELLTWMHVKNEKHQKTQQHLHLAHALQAYEACAPHGQFSYHRVPIARILMSAHERQLLKQALQNERRFCEAKIAALEASTSASLSQLMSGVTYGASGLGGSYGGVPRSGRSMLEGVLNFDSDADTDADVGSEATDLADSEPMAPEPPESAPERESPRASGPPGKPERPTPAPDVEMDVGT